MSGSLARSRGRKKLRFVRTPHIARLSRRQRQKRLMPEICRFYGIVIRFYYRDHPPTHFHAIYGEYEALIEIESGAVYEGYLPGTAYDLVNRWRLLHLQELREDWDRARLRLPLVPIPPPVYEIVDRK